jgi:hypothetical protein
MVLLPMLDMKNTIEEIVALRDMIVKIEIETANILLAVFLPTL